MLVSRVFLYQVVVNPTLTQPKLIHLRIGKQEEKERSEGCLTRYCTYFDLKISYKQITEIFLIDRSNQILLLSTRTPLATLPNQTQNSLRLTENRQLTHLLRGYLVLTDYVLLERLMQLKILILLMSFWELKEQRWTRGRGSS